MIKHIYVSNYALIKELNLDLSNGFTTITGETGAGKSILLGALGLVLGNRAEVKALANDKVKCIVEGTFVISEIGLNSFFKNHELDYEDECILRREILPSGKSRAFVNDTPVKLDVLKALGERLVDIHSQHDSFLMMSPHFQLEILDSLAENSNEVEIYKTLYAEYGELKKSHELLLQELSVQRDTDYIQFLVDELEQANLEENEEDKIEEELQRLWHAEEIKLNLGQGTNELNDDFGVLNRLHNLTRSLESIEKYLPRASELRKRILSAEIELKDVGDEIESLAQETSVDGARLSFLEDRFRSLQHLMQKHQVQSSVELITKFNELSGQLLLATRGAEELKKKEQLIEECFVRLKTSATSLHKSRAKTAKKLDIKVGEYLSRLQLKSAELHFEVEMFEKPFTNGFDNVNLLFKANQGSKMQPINKVVSGGELSRVMLALKAILAESRSLPAIIFDEIDTGISGETAKRAASILNEMGEKMQVIAITHLPQIAACGKTQLHVSKEVENGSTTTRIQKLNEDSRVEEIARLLSGEAVSEAARKTAVELLAV